jgi:serine/threonine-protein kinase/endoribonuclease IRE1
MPPILYLLYAALLLFKLFSASCLADTLQSPSNSQALVHRSPDPPHDDPPLSQDLELLDIVLVASVDGKFHALNRTSGHTLWSMSSFAPTTASVSAPPTLGPLIRTTHVDLDPETTTDDAAHQEMYIIEPQSGDIYIMATPSSPLQRFPFSMPELVDMSPFTYLGDEERRVFVGRKETSLLLIELETGKVKATLNSECPWDPFEDLKNDEMDLDLDQLEEGPLKPSAPTEVFIGRTGMHSLCSHEHLLIGSRLPHLDIQPANKPYSWDTSSPSPEPLILYLRS